MCAYMQTYAQEMHSSLAPSLFGITGGWETTACEPNYGGAFRFSFLDGSRKVAVTDFQQWVQYSRSDAAGTPLASGGLSLASIRSAFRNLDEDSHQVLFLIMSVLDILHGES